MIRVPYAVRRTRSHINVPFCIFIIGLSARRLLVASRVAGNEEKINLNRIKIRLDVGPHLFTRVKRYSYYIILYVCMYVSYNTRMYLRV